MIRQHTLPGPIVKRAEAFDKGRQWLKDLDQMIKELEAQWHIRVRETLSGGTHSFAAAVGREYGTPCILKIHLPEDARFLLQIAQEWQKKPVLP